jgi:hypothetical protein
MIDSGSRTKKPRSRKTAAPVRRITVSEADRKAYEEMVTRRDERVRTYEQHLGTDRR